MKQQEELAFEERAENLTKADLANWTVLSDAERKVVKKLIGPGAKVLSGPRGSGKSTLFRTAFFEAAKTKAAFAVYVNYSKALAIEPLFHSHADAGVLFRQWVLAKILVALKEAFEEWGLAPTSSEAASISECGEFIHRLEAGSVLSVNNTPSLSPTSIMSQLRRIAGRAGVARSVLLLDDAAHAFSVRQQREFFEIFRELRSRDISGKVAIYPGVTSFSPTFQIGHEAELIEAWFRPDQDQYLETMRGVVRARYPSFAPRDSSVIDLLALASFGLPRSFLSMCYELQDGRSGVNIRNATLGAISINSELINTVFDSIADRLPRFEHFIDFGKKFRTKSLAAIRQFNAGKGLHRKAVTVALAEPVHENLDRVLRFMEYAGLVRKIENLSKGSKGSYRRYLIHYSALIDSNALYLGRNYRVSDIVAALESPSAHALVKTKAETLLGVNFAEECVLALPPCPVCDTKRISEDQKFCMNCGHELRAASVYHDLLEADIDSLPLPKRKIEALKEQGFVKVRQLLSDENQSFRKPGSSIGLVWSKRIVTAAEEWVSV